MVLARPNSVLSSLIIEDLKDNDTSGEKLIAIQRSAVLPFRRKHS
jgi:hypothetical protein